MPNSVPWNWARRALRVHRHSAAPAKLALTHVLQPSKSTYKSSGGAVVVVQHAAQTLASLDLARVTQMARFWADESVAKP